MVPVRLFCDVVGENRVRFYRDIDLPFAPFPKLMIAERPAQWSVYVDAVWWSVDEGRFWVFGSNRMVERGETDREAHEYMTALGWKLYGLGIGQ